MLYLDLIVIAELVKHIDYSIIPAIDDALDEEASKYLRNALLGLGGNHGKNVSTARPRVNFRHLLLL